MDPKDTDAASVHSLLIWWEVENGAFPCGAARFTQVLTEFTKELKRALSAMESPYREVKSARVRRLIAAGAGESTGGVFGEVEGLFEVGGEGAHAGDTWSWRGGESSTVGRLSARRRTAWTGKRWS